jgi:hypothetical protein
LLDSLRQSDETPGIENRFVHCHGRGIGLIGPLTRNGKAPEDRSLEKKRVDAAYATAFEDRETLPTERVERMRYRRRAQGRAVEKCSSL